MAVGDANVFPGFLTAVLTQISFQSLRLLISVSAEVRGKNTPGRESDMLTIERSRQGQFYVDLQGVNVTVFLKKLFNPFPNDRF